MNIDKYSILIDDMREIFADIIIREPVTAMSLLPQLKDQISTLYMDHDLGLGKMTGYDVLCKLVEEQQIYPDCIIMVTSNPVGRSNMCALINHTGMYIERPGFRFEKKEIL